jgi:hypothetical protein
VALDVQAYTVAGSYTWNLPVTTYRRVAIYIVGAGGGGGGSWGSTGTANNAGGGGGGGGAALLKEFPFSAIPSTMAVVVGAGGTAGTGSSTAGSVTSGGTGGSSSVTIASGVVFTANGGTGGPRGQSNSPGSGSGTGATASTTGDVNTAGTDGATGVTGSSASAGNAGYEDEPWRQPPIRTWACGPERGAAAGAGVAAVAAQYWRLRAAPGRVDLRPARRVAAPVGQGTRVPTPSAGTAGSAPPDRTFLAAAVVVVVDGNSNPGGAGGAGGPGSGGGSAVAATSLAHSRWQLQRRRWRRDHRRPLLLTQRGA